MLNVKKWITKASNWLCVKNASFTITNGTPTNVNIFKFGNLCVAHLSINGINNLPAGTWVKIGTIPSGYVPYATAEVSTFVSGGYGFVSVRNTGEVYVQAVSATPVGLIRVVVPYFVSMGGKTLLTQLIAALRKARCAVC